VAKEYTVISETQLVWSLYFQYVGQQKKESNLDHVRWMWAVVPRWLCKPDSQNSRSLGHLAVLNMYM